MQVRHYVQRLHETGHTFEKFIDPIRYGLGDGSLFDCFSSCCSEGLEWCNVVLCGINYVI
jgi:hypothetical protein